MTICLVTDSFPPSTGGIATFCKHLANIFVHKGHRVVVLTVNPLSSDRDITEITDDIVKVTLQESYQAFVHLYKPFFRPGGHDAPNWLAMGLAIRDWLLRNTGTYAIDLIDISDYGGLGTFLVGKDLPPFVISAHGSLHQLQPFNHQFETDHTRVIKRLETSAFENAGAVIAHSYLNKESVEKTFNIRVDFARAPWQSENLPLDSSGEDQGPLVIGGLQNTKGAIVMARTIQESGDEGHPFNLKWIGYDTYTAPSTDLMSIYLANTFPDVWQKRFQWRGRMDYEGTMKELAAGSFLVIPSLWETFNYTALEAAVMGKAAIITKTSGVSYVFKHAHDALLIEPGDTQELAHAIRMLNRDPSLRRQMGEYARSTVLEHFRTDVIYNERFSVYQKVLQHIKRDVQLEDLLNFLNRYTTVTRKGYYALRATLKKYLKPK